MNHSSFDLISRSRIVVVAVVRNVERTLESDLEKINSAIAQFKSRSFFIVESDSDDRTISCLELLQKRIDNFAFISLGTLRHEIPSRIERIARARNVYVDYVRKHKESFDYVLVADLDGVNSEITSEKIASCFLKTGWGVCTANQSGNYYDIFALRAKGWTEEDCWQQARKLVRDGVHPAKAWKISVRDKQRYIEPTHTWIEVSSAFGGLALYDIHAFVQGKYQTETSKEEHVSEHLAFHERICEAGFKIYINPSMINFKYNEHNDFYRPTRRIKFAIKYLISKSYPDYFVRHFMPALREEKGAPISDF